MCNNPFRSVLSFFSCLFRDLENELVYLNSLGGLSILNVLTLAARPLVANTTFVSWIFYFTFHECQWNVEKYSRHICQTCILPLSQQFLDQAVLLLSEFFAFKLFDFLIKRIYLFHFYAWNKWHDKYPKHSKDLLVHITISIITTIKITLNIFSSKFARNWMCNIMF